MTIYVLWPLALCMACIQEPLLIKSGLWWRAYGIYSHLWWWWWWCRWFGLTRNWCCLQESDLDELKLSDDIEVCLFVFCCFWISAIWLAYSEAVINWPRGFRPLSNILDSLTPMKKCFNLLKGHLLLNKFGFFEALQLHTVPLELKNL